MVLSLTTLHETLTSLLLMNPVPDVSKIDPYMTNGMMIKGKKDVQTVGFGVSASLSLFESAIAQGCDALVVHHSFNLPSFNTYDQIFQDRMQFLLEQRISLFGYHFFLDAHPTIGNNVQILQAIGAVPKIPWIFHGAPWGWMGEVSQERSYEQILKMLLPSLSPSYISYAVGPHMVKRVVALSGKGAPSGNGMQRLLDEKIDLYITGEAHEWNRELFTEAKIHFLAGGHYHTEVYGVKALMQAVQTAHPHLKTVWLDLPNPV